MENAELYRKQAVLLIFNFQLSILNLIKSLGLPKDLYRSGDILPEHLLHKHRRSLLNIITTCMKQWIKRKRRNIFDICGN